MSEQLIPVFGCPSCGKRHPWHLDIAGRAARCSCGSRFAVPPEAPEYAADVAAAATAPMARLSQVVRPPQQRPASHVLAPVAVGAGGPAAPRRATSSAMSQPADLSAWSPSGADDEPAAPRSPVARTMMTGPRPTALPDPTRDEPVPQPLDIFAPETGATDDDVVEDLYEMADNAPPLVPTPLPAAVTPAPLPASAPALAAPARSPAMTTATGATRAPALMAGTLAADGARKFGTGAILEDEQAPTHKAWELPVAAALIPLGVWLSFVEAMSTGEVSHAAGEVSGGVMVTMILNISLMFGAIMIATMSIEGAAIEEPWWKVLLKVVGIALIPGPVGSIVDHAIGDINGNIAGVFSALGLYVALFYLLFRWPVLATGAVVMLIWTIRTLVMYAKFRAEGAAGGSWI